MLKNIDKRISPELLKVLCEMGHGDEIVIADGNFPSASINKNTVRADGLGVSELLRGILPLFPLDALVKSAVFFMDVPAGEQKPEIWSEYKKIIEENGEKFTAEYLDRGAFYERAAKSYAVVATGESALFANVILRKGTC